MEARILSFMEDMASKDASRVAGWFTDCSTLWIPPAKGITGLPRINALFRAMFSRYEYLQWDIVEIIPISNSRCFHVCISKGKMKGQPEYTNRVITDIVFDEDGKILSLSDYFKDTAVFNKSSPA
jgi:limonene-1,2-epoxide hydrolase